MPDAKTRLVAGLAGAALVAGGGAALWHAGRAGRAGHAAAILHDGHPGPSDKVVNGTAYVAGGLAIDRARFIAVPAGFKVVRGKVKGRARVALAKTLAFSGHPPRPMSIDRVHPWLGCAWRVDGDHLTLATFGEWKSREGGAYLTGTIWLPSAVKVTQEARLAGEDSPANGESDGEDDKGDYWYGAKAPKAGWTPLATHLDTER